MNMVLWIALGVACLLIGREVGGWLFSGKKTGSNVKRSAQRLAIALRETGLKRLPEMLEEFVVGDVSNLISSIQELSAVVKGGNEAILKELDGTFSHVLDAKLRTPEGRAVIKAKIDEVEQTLLRVAVAAAPVAEKMVLAAIVAPK